MVVAGIANLNQSSTVVVTLCSCNLFMHARFCENARSQNLQNLEHTAANRCLFAGISV